MSRCSQWWGIAKRIKKRKELERKKNSPPSHICSEGGSLCCPLLLVIPTFVVPAIHCPCVHHPHYSSSLLSIVPAFVVPIICHPHVICPSHLCCPCCPCHSSSPWFIVPTLCCPQCSLSAVCCPSFVVAVIISTSNSPYEHWLIGGLVVLCEVAVMVVAEVAVGGAMLLLLAIAIAV